MSEEIENKLIAQIQQLQKQVDKLEGKNKNAIPTYSFSTIKNSQLIKLVQIEENLIDNETTAQELVHNSFIVQ